MTFQGDPYRTLGISPGRVAQRDPLGVPAAGQAVPPGRGRRPRPAAVPRDPGGLRAARRRRGPAAARGRRRRVRRPAVGRGLASATRRGREPRVRPGGPSDERLAPRPGRVGREARPPGATPTGGRTRGRGRAAGDGGGEAPPRERHTRRGFRKATPGSTTYDEAAERPSTPSGTAASWYGQTSRHLLDDQPPRVRRPTQARARVPARARRAAARRRCRGRRSQAAGAATGSDEADAAGDATAGPNATAGAERPRRAGAAAQSTTTDGGDAGWGTRGWAYEDGRRAAPPRRRGVPCRRRRIAAGAAEPLPDLEAVARRASPTNLLAIARRPGWRWRLLVALDRLAAGRLRHRDAALDGHRLRRVLGRLSRAAAAAAARRPAAGGRRRCSRCRRPRPSAPSRRSSRSPWPCPSRGALGGPGPRRPGRDAAARRGRAGVPRRDGRGSDRGLAAARRAARRPPLTATSATTGGRRLGRMQRRHDPADISAAAQEYLLALRVMGSDGRAATTAQLGRHVGVTTQAASEMCRRLAADGLVEPATGRGLVLTAAGRAAADAIFRRHALLEWLLTSRRGADLGGERRRGDAPPGRAVAARRVEARRAPRAPRDVPPRQPDRPRDRRAGDRPARRSRRWSPGRRRRSCGSPRRPRRTRACSRTSRPGR